MEKKILYFWIKIVHSVSDPCDSVVVVVQLPLRVREQLVGFGQINEPKIH